MDMMTDVNTIIANYERTCAANAARSRAVADEAAAQMERPENIYIKDGFRNQRDTAADQAAIWEARRAEAARGFFLSRAKEELNDASFMQQYSDALGAAQRSGRVVYQSTQGDERIQRDATGAGDPGIGGTPRTSSEDASIRKGIADAESYWAKSKRG